MFQYDFILQPSIFLFNSCEAYKYETSVTESCIIYLKVPK